MGTTGFEKQQSPAQEGAGKENPADLLTKHSLSQERVLKLTKLSDCHFKDGRAETAPKLRTGATTKKRIGDADNELDAVQAQEVQAQEEQSHDHEPRMPHTELNANDLDREYPSLQAPNELEMDDLSKLEDEHLYNAGMRVVQDILNEMEVAGRTRKAGLQAQQQQPPALLELTRVQGRSHR